MHFNCNREIDWTGHDESFFDSLHDTYAAVSQNYQILIISGYAAIKLPNYKFPFIDK